jgi:hypothetical protein
MLRWWIYLLFVLLPLVKKSKNSLAMAFKQNGSGGAAVKRGAKHTAAVDREAVRRRLIELYRRQRHERDAEALWARRQMGRGANDVEEEESDGAVAAEATGPVTESLPPPGPPVPAVPFWDTSPSKIEPHPHGH